MAGGCGGRSTSSPAGASSSGLGRANAARKFDVLGSTAACSLRSSRRAWNDHVALGRRDVSGTRASAGVLRTCRSDRNWSGDLVIDASADPAIDRAARMADGFLTSAAWGAGNVVTYRKVRKLSQGTDRQKRFPVHVALEWCCARVNWLAARWLPPSPTSAAATRSGAPTGASPSPGPIRPEDLSWERYFVGNPEEVAEALRVLRRGALPSPLLLGTSPRCHPRTGADQHAPVRLRCHPSAAVEFEGNADGS